MSVSKSEPSGSPVTETSAGIIRARRKTIDQGPSNTDITPGAKIRFFWATNVGSQDIKINFDSDAAANYYLLKSGKDMPFAVPIIASTTIHCRAVGGASTLEYFIWG